MKLIEVIEPSEEQFVVQFSKTELKRMRQLVGATSPDGITEKIYEDLCDALGAW